MTKINQYFVSDAELLENGTLRLDWCGTSDERLVTGVNVFLPGDSDYKFWLWLTQKLKRRWYQIGSLPGLDESAIAGHRQEYQRELKTNQPKQEGKPFWKVPWALGLFVGICLLFAALCFGFLRMLTSLPVWACALIALPAGVSVFALILWLFMIDERPSR